MTEVIEIKSKKKLTPELIATIKEKLDSGEKESSVRAFLREELQVSKSRGNEIYNDIKRQMFKSCQFMETKIEKESDKIKNLEFQPSFIFNKEDKTYVVFLKSASRAILVDEAKHKSMQMAYSGKEEVKVEDICISHNFPIAFFDEYKRIFSWTRHGSILTDEEVENNTIEESVENIVSTRRWEILQESKKRLWKETEDNSRKWLEIENGIIDPIVEKLKSWTPPPIRKLQKPEFKKQDLSLIISLNDTHISELARKEEMFSGADYNSEIAAKLIDDYCSHVINDINNRNQSFKDAYIFVNGDYLNSTIDGKTFKGTILSNDKVNEEMFELGLDILVRFTERISEVIPKIYLKTFIGNHDSFLLSYLGHAAKQYFREDDSVDVEVVKSWAKLVKINNIAALVMHGGHHSIKAAIPNSPIQMKAYFQQMFLEKSKEIAECSQRIVISGHKHSYLQSDMGTFEFYCCGAMPLGSDFGDAMNLRSTPRQNYLVLNNNRVIETLHCYF